MISLVINTCAEGPISRSIVSSRGAGQPYAQRAYVLQNFIIPQAIEKFGEVIVVGEWHDGKDYTYIPCESKAFDCTDALEQRQLGFEASVGDIVAFQHDDHIFEGDLWPMDEQLNNPDVLVPERYTRLRRSEGELLNNGLQAGYISGHFAFYNRAVLEACPWKDVPKVHIWDKEHTEQIQEASFGIHWGFTHRVYDVEMGAAPWK